MPYDCRKLNHYIYQKNRYRKAAEAIGGSMWYLEGLLSTITADIESFINKLNSSESSSSGYLADLYDEKRGVVTALSSTIGANLEAGVNNLKAQLQTARTQMNYYADLEASERKKKEEFEKLESGENNGV